MEAWIDTPIMPLRVSHDWAPIHFSLTEPSGHKKKTISATSSRISETTFHENTSFLILTTKHTLSYCLRYADRAWETGFRSLVVLGGDTTVGERRGVPHGSDLRQLIRTR